MNIIDFNDNVFILDENNNFEHKIDQNIKFNDHYDYSDVRDVNIFQIPCVSAIGLTARYYNLAQLTNILPLTINLTKLKIQKLQLQQLPKLPDTLKVLYCEDNLIKILPKLPLSMTHLYAECNSIEHCEDEIFPPNLHIIFLGYNKLKTIPKYHDNEFSIISFNDNSLTEIPKLPKINNFAVIDFSGNEEIKEFPKIPVSYNCNISIDDTNIERLPLHDPKLVIFNYERTPLKNFLEEEYKPMNMYMKDEKEKYDAVKKIEIWFLKCKYNPEYKYCKNRLNKEYEKMFKSA